MARQLSPRQEEALLLMQVRIAEYCEEQGVPEPAVRFRPDLFNGHTNAVYEAEGIKGARPDHCITVFSMHFAYDDAERERVLGHELLHYFERLGYDADRAAGMSVKDAWPKHFTHALPEYNTRGRLRIVGDAHGQHHPAFYRKLDQLLAHMAEVRPA